MILPSTLAEATKSMRIDRLTVSNFRRFENNTFALHHRFTLLVGDNGAGKTTILDALRVGVGAYLLGIPDSQARPIKRDCIRVETRQGGEFPTFEPVAPCGVRCEGRVHGRDLCWSRELASLRGRTNRVGARALAQCVDKHVQEDKQAMKDKRAMSFPLMVSYDTDRFWIKPRETERLRSAVRQPFGKASRFAAYGGCLEPKVSSAFLRGWIKKMALIALKEEQPLQSLDVVYGAVVGCVEGAERATYDFGVDDIVLDFDGGRRFPFALLSDGQRSMAALAADIAWRCVQLNPHLAGQATHETEGVVLIDELDLHLHPNWQRRVVSDLISLFPKLQFVATTHSPFIVQSLDGHGLINLDHTSVLEKRKEPYSIEDIAEETMGVDTPQRSKRFLEMENKARDYYKLLDKYGDEQHSDVVQTKAELDRIEADFSDDPAYTAFLKLHRYAAG